MHIYSISEMDDHARILAAHYGMGLELIGFCIPENMENEAYIARKQAEIAGLAPVSLHAPYYEIFPSAIDPMIRSVALHRMRQTIQLCERLGIKRMIAHSGYAPQLYYPQWFVPKSIDFWREIAAFLPDDFELLLENVLDVHPDHIARVCQGVNDERIQICLDVGHANAYSDVPVAEWIRTLGSRIAHVHLHNNDGKTDQHAALDCGNMQMRDILNALDMHAPDAAICIESMDASACLNYLSKEGFIQCLTPMK